MNSKSSREWLEQRLGTQGAEVMVQYVEDLERKNHEWVSGKKLHHVQVDRVARLIWSTDTVDGLISDKANEALWTRNLDEYRARARAILSGEKADV